MLTLLQVHAGQEKQQHLRGCWVRAIVGAREENIRVQSEDITAAAADQLQTTAESLKRSDYLRFSVGEREKKLVSRWNN